MPDAFGEQGGNASPISATRLKTELDYLKRQMKSGTTVLLIRSSLRRTR